ncbi:GNAT family N-acetyltransferase [Actinosynnema sp. NPDC053489]|uniref:GNAT family N-acetyltransferase n=1 Tax=Actinosynnema sp. NPDC053489 TaxID=3363916 RepID=UPI0037CBACAA
MAEAVVEPFRPAGADEGDLADYYRVLVDAQGVDRPDEPIPGYGTVVGRLDSPFPGLGPATHWVARVGGRVVAFGNAHFPEAENGHIAVVDVVVHPSRRRGGIGTALLAVIGAEARARGRRLLEGWQVVQGGSGERWAAASGFRPVRSIAIQALEVAEVDHARWRVAAPAGYRVVRWTGAAPEELVASYAAARSAINDAPVGESGFRQPEWTVARVREHEAGLREQGIEQRTVVAVEVATGDVVGLTELVVPPHRPDWGYQQDTAVLVGHRGHGLGLAIKACLVRHLVAERPGITRVQTATGSDNAHMIRVNHLLGFRTVRTLIAMSREVRGG